MTIRTTAPGDAPEWLRLRQALWPDCPAERHALEMAQLAATPASSRGAVLVAARADGTLGGFAEVSVRHDHVEGTASPPVAYLEGWYVEPGLRGGGVGQRLLAAVEQWAAARGFRELASDAELANQPAIETHLRCGFQEVGRNVQFVKPVAAGEGNGNRPPG